MKRLYIIIIIIIGVFVVSLLIVKCRFSMRMENLWNDSDGGNQKDWEKTLSQCQLFNQHVLSLIYMTLRRIEADSPL